MADDIQIFRCRICGDPYIGTEAPGRCPFCGARKEYLVDAAEWDPSEFEVELSEMSRMNLEKALDLEINNAGFYECAMDKAKAAGNEYYIAKFKALKKVESEHAAAICKFLKISAPSLPAMLCSNGAEGNTREGWCREKKAIESYSQFANEATEPRLKEFFGALVEIETDHLNLHASKL